MFRVMDGRTVVVDEIMSVVEYKRPLFALIYVNSKPGTLFLQKIRGARFGALLAINVTP